MSNVTASRNPLAAAAAAPARTPPAGPDSSRAAGSSAASSTGTQPARRRHHQHLVGHVADAAQVGPAPRAQRGVDHGGDRALDLAHLGRDLVRARDVVATRPQHVGHRPLVGRLEVGVQQAHGHHLDLGRDGRHGVGSHRGQLAPVGGQPAGHLVAVATRHHRLGARGQVVVERRAVLPADLDHVAEALGRDQGHGGAAALEQRVGGDGRAVRQQRRSIARDRRVPSRGRRRRRTAARMARLGSSGVDSTLTTSPAAVTRSVKVPPVSTPTCTARNVPAHLARRGQGAVPDRPDCVFAASTASRSTRSFMRSPECPLTHRKRHVAPPAHQLDERLPQVAVGDRLAGRVLPAACDPALPPPVAEAVHDVGRVADHVERARVRLHRLEGGGDLHALVGGARRVAAGVRPVGFGPGPPAGARVAQAGAVGEHHDSARQRRHGRGTGARHGRSHYAADPGPPAARRPPSLRPLPRNVLVIRPTFRSAPFGASMGA